MATQIQLLKKYGLPVRGASGQHLLIDPNVQRKIVDLASLKPHDLVLEIGPGLGALTEEILDRGSRVVAVEKDERFSEILKGELAGFPKTKFEIICGDILKINLANIIKERKLKKGSQFKVISNLPYYITAPILFHLFDYHRLISHAVLTMQKEVAARLLAAPGTKDYGRLTLGVRFYADVEYAFDISPSCFTPRPEVDSSVVVLTFHPPSKLPKGVDQEFLFYLIQIAFGQRRKTLFHILARDPKVKIDRDRLRTLFETLGLSPTVRGEELLLKDFLSLAEQLLTHGGEQAGKR